jgi:hypothetical protein
MQLAVHCLGRNLLDDSLLLAPIPCHICVPTYLFHAHLSTATESILMYFTNECAERRACQASVPEGMPAMTLQHQSLTSSRCKR